MRDEFKRWYERFKDCQLLANNMERPEIRAGNANLVLVGPDSGVVGEVPVRIYSNRRTSLTIYDICLFWRL